MTAVVTCGPTGDAFIDGVLGDAKWAVNSLTYSFPSMASFYGPSYGDGEPGSAFQTLNLMQQIATKAALTLCASVANLTFAQITETTSQHADLRFAMSDMPKTAWAYLPSTDAAGGDAWFNNSGGSYDNPKTGDYANLTFIHELGHALGLEHSHTHFVMPHARDSMEYTVMSYRSYVGASATVYTNERWGFAQSLMMYDIAALQHLYGADYTTEGGDTFYSWSPTTGEMLIDGVGQGAPGANRIFRTVWDGGGTDTYDFSRYSSSLKVDLQPGGWTTTASTQLAKLHYDASKVAAGNIANALLHNGDTRSLIENAIGGSGNDSVIGNQASNGLRGGAGDDSLTGGAGDDVLDGSLGTDTAFFRGQRSHYGITQLSGGSTQVVDLRSNSPDGRDVVSNTEWFKFGDELCSIDQLFSDLATVALTTLPNPGDPDILLVSSLLSNEPALTLSGGTGSDRLYGAGGNDELYGRGGRDVLHGALGADRLDGGTGIDAATYTGAAAAVVADLLSPRLNTGDAAGDLFVSIENLLGGAYGDTLGGNKAPNVVKGRGGNDTLIGRGGNDSLAGGAGDDLLRGGTGQDVLIGGTGQDAFTFKAAGDSHVSSRDTIKDFVRGQDRIDLSAIDANTMAGGNQSFLFVGQSAFSGKAGQLSYSGGVLSGDLNGDKVADFEVNVSGHMVLAKGDFHL
jgi:serralysin